MNKQFSYQKGFRKGYQQGFADGVKMGKSLFKPKLPEVNEKCEPERLNYLVSCLNCDFYKNFIVGGQPFIGDSPYQWCENQPDKISFTPATTATTAATKIDKGNK